MVFEDFVESVLDTESGEGAVLENSVQMRSEGVGRALVSDGDLANEAEAEFDCRCERILERDEIRDERRVEEAGFCCCCSTKCC